jgi:hypothetical protein
VAEITIGIIIIIIIIIIIAAADADANQLLIYAIGANILGESKHTTKNNTEALVVANIRGLV